MWIIDYGKTTTEYKNATPTQNTYTQTAYLIKKKERNISKKQNYDIVYGIVNGKKNKIGVYMCLFEII